MTSTITLPLPPDFLETLIEESCKVPARVWQATFRGLLEADVPPESGAITAPTLILWGDELARRGDQEALRPSPAPSSSPTAAPGTRSPASNPNEPRPTSPPSHDASAARAEATLRPAAR